MRYAFLIGSLAVVLLLLAACGGGTPPPMATSAAVLENPCGYVEADPTPVPLDRTPTPAPTEIPTPFGTTPTPTVEIEVPRYPDLPLAAPDTLLWLDAVVTVELTFKNRSADTIQGLVVNPDGLVLTSLDPVYLVNSMDVAIGGVTHPAELLRYDPRTNAALLRVDALELVAAPQSSVEVQPGEPAFAWIRDADGGLTRMRVVVSPSINARDVLAALLSYRSRTVNAGVTITDLDGQIIGITQRAGGQWTGTSFSAHGPFPGPDQPIVLFESALALLDGSPERAGTLPAAVAYHGANQRENWLRLADGPATQDIIADPVQELLGRVGEPINVEDLGQRARRVLGDEAGFFLELLDPEPQTLRTPDGEAVAEGRYIVLWWGREAGLPDLLLCGETADRLGAAFAMPLLGHLEQVRDEAPRSSRSVVRAAPLPVGDEDFRSYPYKWTFATDKESYAFGEPVRLTLAIKNISGFSMPLNFTPPMVLIRGIGPRRDVALVPHGNGHRDLRPGETATFEITWDAQTAWGELAPPGDYQAQALIANNVSEFSVYGVTGPQAEFTVTESK